MAVIIGQSAKLYQERRQPNVQTTMRGPGPQVYFPDNAVHHLQLEPPLPIPDLVDRTPVDTGETQVWPHGNETVV
jgi:hypothetical protein